MGIQKIGKCLAKARIDATYYDGRLIETYSKQRIILRLYRVTETIKRGEIYFRWFDGDQTILTLYRSMASAKVGLALAYDAPKWDLRYRWKDKVCGP